MTRTRTRPPKAKELTIVDAILDDRLLGRFIKDIDTYKAWMVFLKAFYGIQDYTQEELGIFKEISGRDTWPTEQAMEAWLVIGTRGGKSFTIALLSVFLSCFVKYPQLAEGERGQILVVAPTRKQSGIIKEYAAGMIQEHPLLRTLVDSVTTEEIRLTNNISITTISSDYRSLRGFTAVACIADELAYFNTEGSKPDTEVVRALRSRLTSTEGPLLCISSPYAKKGELHNAYRKHFGKDSDILVLQAPSRTMNPTLSQKIIDRAIVEDPEAAKADYLALFREDISDFVDPDIVQKAVMVGVRERSPERGLGYIAFVDPAGGGGADAMTLAIVHNEGNISVVDALRVVYPPFSPEAVTVEFSELLHRFSIRQVTGDRFGGEWPRERFAQYNIEYESAKKSKSELYQDFLPLINSGKVRLLDDKTLIKQLVALERRVTRGSRDIIDHPPGGHDDAINAVAGAVAHPQEVRYAGTWSAGQSERFSPFRQIDERVLYPSGTLQADENRAGAFGHWKFDKKTY